jgi:hypothetical protein
MKMTTLLDTAPCSFVEITDGLEVRHCLRHHCAVTEALLTSETSVCFYKSRRCLSQKAVIFSEVRTLLVPAINEDDHCKFAKECLWKTRVITQS